jgi:beta-aspartyl-peptidase (threonine type)
VRPAIIVHGGAGTADAEGRDARRAGCLEAVRRAWSALLAQGSAIDAAVAAVVALEDDPNFNAGTGSCLTEDGRVEMDASLMEGTHLGAGAVGAVEGIRNPILLARAILADGRHVLLVGPQAARFAAAAGVPTCDPGALVVERRKQQHRAWVDRSPGTVGAVAVDARGQVVAATSTGGIMGKRPGRVGDSAVIGAGTYADDRLGAASATGPGEAIIRFTLARHALDLVGTGRHPAAAAVQTLGALLDRLDSRCGLILADHDGQLGAACTAEEMPVAYMHAGLATPIARSEPGTAGRPTALVRER